MEIEDTVVANIRFACGAWGDYRDMIASEDLDAVVIATPHHLHAPMGLDCLEAGLHTFVEKRRSMPVDTGSEADRDDRGGRRGI